MLLLAVMHARTLPPLIVVHCCLVLMLAAGGACRNSQTITVQDMPESSPLGQIPRWVTCYCEGDLVDKVKPGACHAMPLPHAAGTGVPGLQRLCRWCG